MRRCGTEYASSRGGLNPDVIATMTKHKLPGMGDIQTTYMTELSPKVLACMSHTDKDDYFVARTRIDVDSWYPHLDMVKHVFWHYDDYVTQLEQPGSDESTAAHNFVFKLLPWLTKVILQDACFWVTTYPNHQVSQMLLGFMPADFEDKCRQGRAFAENLTRERELQKEAEQNLQRTMVTKMDAMERKLEAHPERLRTVVREEVSKAVREQVVPAINTAITNAMATHAGAGFHHTGRRGTQAPPPPPPPPAAQEVQVVHVIPPPPVPPVVPPPQQPPQPPPHQRAQQAHWNQLLRRRPRQPVVPTSMPETCLQLKAMFEQNRLAEFETARRRDWPQDLQIRYGKWLYMYKVMRERARLQRGDTHDQRMVRAASRMEDDRIMYNKTMAGFLRYLKKEDAATRTRNRRAN